MDDLDFLLKFLIIGDAGTGKSCILHSFIESKCKSPLSLLLLLFQFLYQINKSIDIPLPFFYQIAIKLKVIQLTLSELSLGQKL